MPTTPETVPVGEHHCRAPFQTRQSNESPRNAFRLDSPCQVEQGAPAENDRHSCNGHDEARRGARGPSQYDRGCANSGGRGKRSHSWAGSR